MVPNGDQIARAAYFRWLRRGRAHGRDRDDWVAAEKELMFGLNYQVIVDYPLNNPHRFVLGERAMRRCRFCERASGRAVFSQPRAVVMGTGNASLLSAEVCDDCHADCREPLTGDLHRLWEAIWAENTWQEPHHAARSRAVCSLAAFKALVASALLIMPERELTNFADALEWVANPDPDFDSPLFTGLAGRAYFAPFLREQSAVCLARRIDDDAPLPYMVFSLAWGGAVVQVSVPLCVRDLDLDGRSVATPERSYISGEHHNFREARSTTLPLVPAWRMQKAHPRRALLSS
jgi:hypothetical protein